jgi:hypothetical protein
MGEAGLRKDALTKHKQHFNLRPWGCSHFTRTYIWLWLWALFFFFSLFDTILLFLNSFYFIIFTFTHMCIQCLDHLPLPTPHAVLPSCIRFVEEKAWDNKKDITFWLVWDKDNDVERFLVLFPCTCVLQPTLVHLCQTSSLLLSPFP